PSPSIFRHCQRHGRSMAEGTVLSSLSQAAVIDWQICDRLNWPKVPCCRSCRYRQTLHRRPAVPEHVGRPRAGVFRRRHGRGDHHRALPYPLAVRDRPQFELRLQGPGHWCETNWARTRCGYVLEGSVRKAGGRVRIAAQLIEAETGTHLWADRFDGSLEAIFDLQDQVAISVAGIIEPALQAVEIRRALDPPRNDPTAYDLYLRALRAMGSWEKKDYLEALDWLSQATKQDPTYGRALALSAVYHKNLNVSGWPSDPEAPRQKAISLARRAVRNAGDDAATLGKAAWVLGHEDIDVATALIDRSLQINPSFADGWRWSGWLRLWAGLPDVAVDHFEKCLRLDPRGFLVGDMY